MIISLPLNRQRLFKEYSAKTILNYLKESIATSVQLNCFCEALNHSSLTGCRWVQIWFYCEKIATIGFSTVVCLIAPNSSYPRNGTWWSDKMCDKQVVWVPCQQPLTLSHGDKSHNITGSYFRAHTSQFLSGGYR